MSIVENQLFFQVQFWTIF